MSASELWKRYEAASVEVMIGEEWFVFPPVSSRELPALPTELRPCGVIITACNPGSRVVSEDENLGRQTELAEELDRALWPRLPAVGHDGAGGWREPSFAVVGAPISEILELAQTFTQNAVYEWGSGIWRVVAVPPPSDDHDF
jgi:hypothetical protein